MRSISLLFAAIILLMAQSAVYAQKRMATVDGYCFLEGESDHSGSNILFEALSPTAVTDSASTVDTGYYLLGLSEGIYAVHFTHDNFIPYVIPEHTFTTGSTSLPDVILSPGAIIEVGGSVSGEWTSEFLYRVVDDLFIAPSDTLIIYAGITVSFMGNFELLIEGGLFVVGAENDSIKFVSGLTGLPGDWKGVKFSGSLCSGTLDFCIIENAGSYDHSDTGNLSFVATYDAPIGVYNSSVRYSETNGIYLYNSSPQISGNRISHNSSRGVNSVYSSAVINGNTISYNDNCGIHCWFFSPQIIGNTINDNQNRGLDCRNSSPHISMNIIRGNSADGIGCYHGGSPEIHKNTICQNNSGIRCETYTAPLISGNIVAVNTGYGIFVFDPSTLINFNDVWGNTGPDYTGDGLPINIGTNVTTNANGDSSDVYFNISLDPLFLNETDLNLQVNSPCIDAGNPDPVFYDLDGTISDIGALPYFQGDPLPPNIDFIASPEYGTSPLPIEFTPTNTGGPIVSWSWDFGDGATSTQPNPVHTYITQELTAFTVTLQVEGPGGTDEVTRTEYILVAPGNFPPIANFSAEPLVGYGDVQFNNLSLGNITIYLWDFGDGAISNEENPLYHYDEPGIYTVSLEVGGSGGTDSIVMTDYISILEPEAVAASFEASSVFDVVPATISFTNTSIGTIDSYFWDFGDDSTSTVPNPVHTYFGPGLYEVTLIASGTVNSDTASVDIEILLAEPVISSILDVPDDQGGQVYLQFIRSGHDSDGMRSEMYTVERNDAGTWVTVISGGAAGQSTYTYLVPTLRDSTEGENGLTEFRVTANMDEGNFVSQSDWGYSVDNIAPQVPEGFTVTYNTGYGNELTWGPCPDTDFQYFRIYRGLGDFVPGDESLIQMTIDLEWIDPDGTVEHRYMLSSVDYAGNESEYAAAIVTDVEDMPAPTRFILAQNIPNPFNPSTEISYTLPRESAVYLHIYDVSGGLVRTLRYSAMEQPGTHRITWDGRDEQYKLVPSGVYFYRLETAEFIDTKRMVLVR